MFDPCITHQTFNDLRHLRVAFSFGLPSERPLICGGPSPLTEPSQFHHTPVYQFKSARGIAGAL